jgi:hypothetical protein
VGGGKEKRQNQRPRTAEIGRKMGGKGNEWMGPKMANVCVKWRRWLLAVSFPFLFLFISPNFLPNLVHPFCALPPNVSTHFICLSPPIHYRFHPTHFGWTWVLHNWPQSSQPPSRLLYILTDDQKWPPSDHFAIQN